MRWISVKTFGQFGRQDGEALIGFGAGGIVGAVGTGKHRISRLVGHGPFADVEVYAGTDQLAEMLGQASEDA